MDAHRPDTPAPAGTPAAGHATHGTGGVELVVNGERRGFPSPITCAGLVEALALAGRRFAFERNGEIVPRSRLADTPLADGDTVEIVVAVGGG